MTLIEVVAGLALMAGVLGGILTAKARVARQSRQTIERRRAIEAADALMRDWFRDVRTLPRQGRGAIAGHPELAWQTLPVRNAPAEALGGQVVRLLVVEMPSTEPPLVSLEFVVPLEVKHEVASLHPH